LALELLRNSFIAPKKRRKQPERYTTLPKNSLEDFLEDL
jgi:hypothetical protein